MIDKDLQTKLLAMPSKARRELVEFLCPRVEVQRAPEEVLQQFLASMALKKHVMAVPQN